MSNEDLAGAACAVPETSDRESDEAVPSTHEPLEVWALVEREIARVNPVHPTWASLNCTPAEALMLMTQVFAQRRLDGLVRVHHDPSAPERRDANDDQLFWTPLTPRTQRLLLDHGLTPSLQKTLSQISAGVFAVRAVISMERVAERIGIPGTMLRSSAPAIALQSLGMPLPLGLLLFGYWLLRGGYAKSQVVDSLEVYGATLRGASREIIECLRLGSVWARLKKLDKDDQATVDPITLEPVSRTPRHSKKSGHPWQLCAPEAARQRLERLGGEKAGDERHRDLRHILTVLENRPTRMLPLTSMAMVRRIEALSVRFPNFADVIDDIARQLALRARLREPLGLEPLLLAGPPGVGKTRFAQAVAEQIGFGLAVHSLAETTAGWVISGASTGWSNSRPGCVASHLAELPDGQAPMIVFDELDKVPTGNYPITPTLLGMLESSTARRFRDECLSMDLDVRPLSLLFTANRLDRIPPEVLSRMTVVNVQTPTADQMPAIVKSVDDGLRVERPRLRRHFLPLSPSVIEKLSASPPRVVRRTLLGAYARASQRSTRSRGRIELVDKDLVALAASERAELRPQTWADVDDLTALGRVH